MVQREVGDRLTAQPGEKTYGRLSVLAQAHAQVRQIMAVPARAFVPPPQIASSVIRLEPRERGARVPGPALERVTAAAFGQRRKMLRSSLKVWAKDSALVLDDVLGSAGLRPDQRAETVPVEAFIALAEAAHVKERKSR
jgi:16S rRNA (adenine1518-N6/adenine1519-N6)-dimethyltransferase